MNQVKIAPPQRPTAPKPVKKPAENVPEKPRPEPLTNLQPKANTIARSPSVPKHRPRHELFYPMIGSKNWTRNQIDTITLTTELKPHRGTHRKQQSQHRELIEAENLKLGEALPNQTGSYYHQHMVTVIMEKRA